MKICQECKAEFEVSEKEKGLLKKLSPNFGELPEPKICPACRNKIRLSFRNEKNLHLRHCENCDKKMVSIYPPEMSQQVWCQKCWWSDQRKQMEGEQDFDFNKPFFEQWEEVFKNSKLLTLFGANNENSEFVNQETDDKNCYMNAGGHYNEDCYYNTYCIWGKNNVDNYWVTKSELLYQSIFCHNCFASSFLEYCENCSDCHYCRECKGSKNCFGSYGLSHKEYYFFNQPLSKEDYQEKIKAYLNSAEGRTKALKESREHFLKYPQKAAHILNCIDSSGDNLANCKNANECYLFENSEDIQYSHIGMEVKDSMDISCVGWAELIYNCASAGRISHAISTVSSMDTHFAYYSFLCFNSNNIFGCIGLNQKKYCILNKQYSEEEYKNLVTKIAAHMKKTGEWGQFFPSSLSPFQIKRESKSSEENQQNNNSPICNKCGKNYRIITEETKFYKKMNLPEPDNCPSCREVLRMRLITPQKLWIRKCNQCDKEVKTSYSPERPEIIFCNDCYLSKYY